MYNVQREEERKEMRKLFIVLVLIVCVMMLVSCGSEEEEFTPSGTPSEQIQQIIDHYAEKIWHGEITDVQINENAEGEGYIVLVFVDWDLENKPENARGVLQAYSDELCTQLAENGNTAQFYMFFNAIQQGGTYKRGYTIEYGEITPTQEACTF